MSLSRLESLLKEAFGTKNFWISPEGEVIGGVEPHLEIGERILKRKGIMPDVLADQDVQDQRELMGDDPKGEPTEEDRKNVVYAALEELGYWRVVETDGAIMIQVGVYEVPRKIMKELKDRAIENRKELVKDMGNYTKVVYSP